ncbi:Dual specificity mitogen-activated protein kinase kinase 7 [Cichlidogyrus casuarinus]|uniref:mitogen-activated protein kinase kinase n=1 Tax=Cichlidogyrus casuarinus TaxID=1844966 RepID=A0ABD2PNQ2_9PLAT
MKVFSEKLVEAEVSFDLFSKCIFRLGKNNLRASFDDFQLIKEIGKGTCGVVYKAKHTKFNQIFIAAKTMHLTSCSEENASIYSDLRVMLESIECPFIVKCYGISIVPVSDILHHDYTLLQSKLSVYMFMELMDTCLQGLLHRLKKPFPEEVVGKIAVSILEALNYLKEKFDVIHRDIKPSNMLLDGTGVVKLCDFGISGKVKHSQAVSNRAGSVLYMSPERINSTTYGARADIWACGISFLELATARNPYEHLKTNEFAVLSTITTNPAPSLQGQYFSSPFKRFVNAW